MICREICRPEYTEEVIEKFDYFNDFTDTSMYVRHMITEAKNSDDKKRFEDILCRLTEGNEKYLVSWRKQIKNNANKKI